MASRRNESTKTVHNSRQGRLFPATDEHASTDVAGSCHIVSVGRRRDGGTRYWCLIHKADATAKYGRRSTICRAAHLPRMRPDDMFELDLDAHPGGVALWGAVPPVYDTTCQPIDRGIHVHARAVVGGHKELEPFAPFASWARRFL